MCTTSSGMMSIAFGVSFTALVLFWRRVPVPALAAWKMTSTICPASRKEVAAAEVCCSGELACRNDEGLRQMEEPRLLGLD